MPSLLARVSGIRSWGGIALRGMADVIRSFTLGPFDAKDPALARLFAVRPVFSGISVDEQTALTVSAYWCGVNLISGHVGLLPLELMKRLPGGGKERFVDHPTYELVHDRPNPEMSSVIFRRTLQAHALTWGNGYAEIQRDEAGRPVGLWPLTPDRVTPYRAPGSLRLRYTIRRPTNQSAIELDPEDVLHIPGLGFDGIRGYSVVAMARESLGLSLATERFGAQFFGNSASTGGILKHPARLKPEVRAALKQEIDEHLTGDNRRRPLVLEEGMEWSQLGIPPEDGQFLQTRKLQITDVARWLNIPPHKLKDLERATFDNIEFQGIDYLTDTLLIWLVTWEQELARKLIRPLERKTQFFRHNVKGLLRGDTQSRYSAYATARQWGWMSANDILELEDENPIGPRGDIYLTPANMLEAGAPRAPAPPAGAPSPPPHGAEPPRSRGLLVAKLEAISIALQDLRDRPGIEPARLLALEAQNGGLRDSLAALAEQSTAEASRQTDAITCGIEQLRAAIDELRQRLETPASPAPADDIAKILTMLEGMIQPGRGGRDHQPSGDATSRARARLIASQRATLLDAAGRMVRRETGAARRRERLADPEKMRAWVREFYGKKFDVFRAMLQPAIQAHLALIGSGADPTAMAENIVQRHIDRSRSQIHAVLDTQPADLHGELEELFRRWEIERPAALADALIEEEMHAIHEEVP